MFRSCPESKYSSAGAVAKVVLEVGRHAAKQYEEFYTARRPSFLHSFPALPNVSNVDTMPGETGPEREGERGTGNSARKKNRHKICLAVGPFSQVATL